MSNEEALRRTVRTGCRAGTGYASAEPRAFYDAMWDHIVREDIREANFRQALFMSPYRLCLGSAMDSRGLLAGLDKRWTDAPILGDAVRRMNGVTRKLEGLGRLIAHYEELRRRHITFTSGFIGPVTNAIIPSNPLTRALYPDYVGRNTTRMGITRMKSVHFPDGVDALGYDGNGRPVVDVFAAVLTPPDQDGEMSLGLSNGASWEVMSRAMQRHDMSLLVYVNPAAPFTRGYAEARNTLNVRDFEGLAKAGRLVAVHDDSALPSLPAGTFDAASPEDRAIANNIANHIELNLDVTAGRAIQVGFGPMGCLAIKALQSSSWTGRCYTEMLEPYTLGLFESGRVAGTHFIELDGRRTQLDGRIICTFAMAEEGSDFYRKIHDNPAIIVAPAARVVIPEAFHGGLGINSCLSIDFHGHVNISGRDRNYYSGVGGGAMILRGLARGGIAYLCMKSTHRTADGKVRSSVFPYLPQGTPVSYVGPDLMGGRDGARVFLATEHGVAQLSGTDQHSFIQAVVSVAAPQYRDSLRKAAWNEFRVAVPGAGHGRPPA